MSTIDKNSPTIFKLKLKLGVLPKKSESPKCDLVANTQVIKSSKKNSANRRYQLTNTSVKNFYGYHLFFPIWSSSLQVGTFVCQDPLCHRIFNTKEEWNNHFIEHNS